MGPRRRWKPSGFEGLEGGGGEEEVGNTSMLCCMWVKIGFGLVLVMVLMFMCTHRQVMYGWVDEMGKEDVDSGLVAECILVISIKGLCFFKGRSE